MSAEKNLLSDESNDRKYFVQLPQIVWAICRTPQDLTLWFVVKMVAGEGGECILSTEDLAALCTMSAGKVSDSRKYLLAVGAMEGECRRDPGYPQPVWHLRIPDVWEENIRWRKNISGLKERVEFKRELAKKFQDTGTLRALGDESVDLHIKSLHNMKPSQYEGSEPSQYEEGIPQNEGKKNHDSCMNKNEKIPIHDLDVPASEPAPDEPDDESGLAQPDPDLAECCTFYENNLHAVTQYVTDVVKGYLKECPKDWLIEAFEIASENNVRKLRYVQGIMERSIGLGLSPRQAGPPESKSTTRAKGVSPLQIPPAPELSLLLPVQKISKVDQVWLDTLAQLQLTTTKPAFDSLLRPTQLTKPNGKYVLWAETKAQEEWLNGRLRGAIQRTLDQVVGKPVKLEIHVKGEAV